MMVEPADEYGEESDQKSEEGVPVAEERFQDVFIGFGPGDLQQGKDQQRDGKPKNRITESDDAVQAFFIFFRAGGQVCHRMFFCADAL